MSTTLFLAITPLFGATAPAGRYVRIELSGKGAENYLQIGEVEVMSGGKNVALKKAAKQSTVFTDETIAARAVDGAGANYPDSCAVTRNGEKEWWEVDLGANVPVDEIIVLNRGDCCQVRLVTAVVRLLDEKQNVVWKGKVVEAQDKYLFDLKNKSGAQDQTGTGVTVPQGDVALPLESVVFGPFAAGDAAPPAELLRTVPDALIIGGKRVAGRTAAFAAASRAIDLAPFTGPNVKSVAWVYLRFACEEACPATFGFGADGWYEAYLDGKLVSETFSRGDKGNGAWPPSIRDFTATVEVAKGEHVLAVRMIRGTGSALLAVGGPQDLRNPALKKAPGKRDNVTLVTTAGFREGPPAGKKWKLVWNDEFDGKEIDLNRWQHGSEATYVEPENDPNTRLDGQGNLVCTLTLDGQGKPVYGGIHSRSFEKAYGYFETRVQFTTQPGWWGAVWLQGRTWFHLGGSDTFLFPQEFDMFEDFYKPKRRPDISHCYHAVCGLSATVDQGDGKGIGTGDMMARREVGRVSSGRMVDLEEYGGWHTVGFEWTPLEHIWYVDGQETLRQTYRNVPVTCVPQIVKIGGVSRTPPKSRKDGGKETHYGWLEDAKLPDQLKVDYFRVYDEDHAGKEAPTVTLAIENAEGGTLQGKPATFRVQAGDQDGTVKTLYLFSKGHLRAEIAVDAATVDQRFTVSTLFPGRNTVIAMAKDNDGLVGMSAPLRVDVLSGREYTGTAFQGKPQQIPGTILPGHYDEGGNGAAFYQEAGLPVNAAYTWRIGEMKNAMADRIWVGQVDCGVPWVTYQVEVRETGWYDVELMMSRSDYYKNKFVDLLRGVSEPIRLEVDRVKVAEWKLDAQWESGPGWHAPVKPVGKQRVRLEKGTHQLVMRFDELLNHTFFGGLVFVATAD